MMTMSVANTVAVMAAQLVKFNKELPDAIYNEEDGSFTERGIVMKLRVSGRHWVGDPNYGHEVEAGGYLYFLFCGNVSVWSAKFMTSDDICYYSWEQIPTETWRNTSTHDSAWKHDGLEDISEFYFDVATRIKEKAGKPDLAPKDIEISARFEYPKAFDWVDITYMRTEGGYRRQLISVGKVQ